MSKPQRGQDMMPAAEWLPNIILKKERDVGPVRREKYRHGEAAQRWLVS